MIWVIRLLILIQDVFHIHDVIACNLAYAPPDLLPGLGFTFFKVLWILMAEIESTTSSSTSLSAISCIVQLDLPSGGSEQARSVTFVSIVPSIFPGAPLLGFSFSAESKPSWQYLLALRYSLWVKG